MLFYGIIGALLFRALFIAMGSVLMQYHAVVLIFGVFLMITGARMLWMPERKIAPDKNRVIKLVRRNHPDHADVPRAALPHQDHGRWHATPLLVALVFLEMSGIIFAVDSVPVIFAITREPVIVFTSNVFAILGLRAMYFLLAGAVERFHLLKYGLALILIFVGLTMVWLNDLFGGKFPIEWSLGIILALLGAPIVASLVAPVRREEPSADRPAA